MALKFKCGLKPENLTELLSLYVEREGGLLCAQFARPETASLQPQGV